MLKEIWVEDEEELVFVVMVEVKICHREIWSIIDKIELGYHQLIWREEVISDWKCPLNLNHPDFQIGVVWDHCPQELHLKVPLTDEQNRAKIHRIS